jgi:LAO/AO transport system kinase
VARTAAATGEGVDELWDAIASHRRYLEDSGELEAGRRARLVREVEVLASERGRERVRRLLEDDAALVDELGARRIDPYAAAAILMERLGTGP